jgi:hypothetical protein
MKFSSKSKQLRFAHRIIICSHPSPRFLPDAVMQCRIGLWTILSCTLTLRTRAPYLLHGTTIQYFDGFLLTFQLRSRACCNVMECKREFSACTDRKYILCDEEPVSAQIFGDSNRISGRVKSTDKHSSSNF